MEVSLDVSLKINDLTIKGIENLKWLNYFAPQVILPEKTADFFLLHPHHLITYRSKELKVVAIPSVRGKLEDLQKVEPHLEDLTKRAEYSYNSLSGYFLRHFFPFLQDTFNEIVKQSGNKEEIQLKIVHTFIEKTFKQPEIALNLFAGVSLPFIQFLQISLVGYLSRYILDKSRKLIKGLESLYLQSTSESFELVQKLTLTLFRSNIIYPILFTSVCTNPITPHYDFLLSNSPLMEERCRVCESSAITFGIYLMMEPYTSFKLEQRDLSYVIASYLYTKSAGLIECYPEVYVQKDSNQEEIDVFIRNWVTGTIAIAECKVHENPLPTYDTKVNMIKQDLQQLIRKMNYVNAKFGYLITNLHFENDEEVNRVLEDAKSKLKNGLPSNVKLIGKVKGRNVITEWDSILSDLKQS
jgi:hypothetical protein